MKTIRALLILAFVGLTVPAFAQPFAQKDLTSTTCPGSGCLIVQVDGQGSIGIQVTNTFVGTLQFEQSIDGTNYVSVTMIPSTLGASVTATTGVGLWTGPIAGARWIRVRCSAYTSGTASVGVVAAQAKVLGGASGVISSGLFGDGSVVAPSMAFASEPGLGWYRTGTSGIGLAGNSGKTLFGVGSDGSIQMSNPGVNSGNATTVIQLDGSSLLRIVPGINAAGKLVAYNGVTSAGWGTPAIYAAGRFTAQTAAKASVATYTVGAADGSFEVNANVLVTTATSHTFTVTCAYTDESNTARTVTMTFGLVAGGVTTTSITNTNGAVPYLGVPLQIRAKAATAITIATTGTFTTVTYNVEGTIKQIS